MNKVLFLLIEKNIIIIIIVTIRDSHIAYNYMKNQSYSSRRYYVHYNTYHHGQTLTRRNRYPTSSKNYRYTLKYRKVRNMGQTAMKLTLKNC